MLVCPDGFVKAHILGKEVLLKAVFAPVPIVLLGREDFFRRFKVSFDQRKKAFSLKGY